MPEIPLIDALLGGGQEEAPPTTNRRARENTRTVESLNEAWQGVVSAAENMFSTAADHQLGYGRWNCLRAAKVVWAVPYINWCRIQFGSGEPDYPACTMTESAVQPFGIRNSSPIPPESTVLALWDPQAPFAIILGCLPDIMSDGGRVHSGWVSQGSGAGFKRERYYKDMPSLLKEDAGWKDWSNNRPIDSLAIGEWARLDDLGGGIFLDMLMKWLRVDETCGLSLYYMDRLARLFGNNLDLTTSVHEQNVRNDNGEALNYTGSTAYYWEALGAFRTGIDLHREISDEDVHFNKPYGKYEPLHDDQQPFYRFEEFRDYLGQAYMRQVCLPPYNTPDINRFSGEEPRVGVFREQIGMHGGWSVQSAHSVGMFKRLIIPVAKRLKAPESPQGDDLGSQEEGGDGQYKFASKFGEGPDHKIVTHPAAPGDAELPHILTAAAMQDIAAYYFNWQGLHPFHYHLKDFDLPQQDEVEPFTKLQYTPEFGQLSSQMWLDEPSKAQTVPVDHRHQADYYETTAGYMVMPDGSLNMFDGYGFSLRTGGGNAQMSMPGDLIVQPGRSCIIYAGDDTVIRAYRSVDVSSATKDVRVKADRNAEILSGNSGIGRMLFESRATGITYDPEGKEGEDIEDSGIIFKNAQGQIALWSRDVYLRTGGGDVEPGSIVLDADKGTQDVKVIARSLESHLAADATFALGVEEPEVVHRLTRNVADFPTQLRTSGRLTVTEAGAYIAGGVSVINGGVSTDSHADGLMGYTPPGSDSHEIITSAIEAVTTDFDAQASAETEAITQIRTDFWDDNRIGNDDVIAFTQYAPRNDEQLNTRDFKLPQTYWQQLAADSPPAVWNEPEIRYQGNYMMPHPGRAKWVEDTSFYKVQLALHELDKGLDKAREQENNPYDEPVLEDWDKVVPQGNYPIVTS